MSGTGEPGNRIQISWDNLNEYTVNSVVNSRGEWSVSYSSNDVPPTRDSEYTVRVQETDTAGNVTTPPVTRLVKVQSDNIAPYDLRLDVSDSALVANAGLKKNVSYTETIDIGSVNVTDPDGDSIQYSLGDASVFNDNDLVESSTGNISIKAATPVPKKQKSIPSKVAIKLLAARGNRHGSS